MWGCLRIVPLSINLYDWEVHIVVFVNVTCISFVRISAGEFKKSYIYRWFSQITLPYFLCYNLYPIEGFCKITMFFNVHAMTLRNAWKAAWYNEHFSCLQVNVIHRSKHQYQPKCKQVLFHKDTSVYEICVA